MSASVTIKVEAILELCHDALLGQNIPLEVTNEMAFEFLSSELSGNKTHGLSRLVSLDFGDLEIQPTIEIAGPRIRSNGHGGNGFILMREVVKRAIKVCLDHGIVLATCHNFSRYSALYPYTEELAKNGLFVLLANSAGPPAVAPHGGFKPVTGTNPICFSFPTEDGVQTFDFATSEQVWGEIRQAAIEGRPLQGESFIDASGSNTKSPGEVHSVQAFGGPKGWALNLAIEILCGPLADAKMGPEIKSEYDCGAFLFAASIDQDADVSARRRISQLFEHVRNSADVTGVRVPGDRIRGKELVVNSFQKSLEVPKSTVYLMKKMAEGKVINQLSRIHLFN